MKLKNRLKNVSALRKKKPEVADQRLTLEQELWMQESVSAFLSSGSVYTVWMEGPWDLEAIEKDLGEFLLRSSMIFRSPVGSKSRITDKQLVFALSDDCYIYVWKGWVRVFSRYQKEAQDIAEGWMLCYRAKPRG